MSDTTNTSEHTEPNEKHPAIRFAGQIDLRDYFAAKAMQAIIGCYKNTLLGDRNFDDSHDFSTFARDIAIDKNGQTSENEGCNEIAQDAYAFADAMLKARHP